MSQGFASWDDVPDVSSTGRSLVKYPDPDPVGTAKMWDRLRAEREARREAGRAADREDVSGEVYRNYETPVITRPSEEFDDPCRSLAGYVKLAHTHGWNLVTLAHAFSEVKGRPFAGGENAGKRRPTRSIELQYAYFEKPGVGRATVSVPIVNGLPASADVVRRFNGRPYGDRELKNIMKGNIPDVNTAVD